MIFNTIDVENCLKKKKVFVVEIFTMINILINCFEIRHDLWEKIWESTSILDIKDWKTQSESQENSGISILNTFE